MILSMLFNSTLKAVISKVHATLDEMVEQAFDDQCTGANPRYPLMSEIKQMYINAYEGIKK